MSRRRNDFFGDGNNGNSAFFNLSDDGNKSEDTESLSLFGENQKNTHSNTSKPVSSHKPVMQTYEKREPVRIKRRRIRRKPKQKANTSVVLLVSMVYAVVGFVVCSLMITRYSYICTTDDNLSSLQTEIDELESIVEAKQLEVSLKDDISMVQTKAKKDLNMNYPKNDQIIYIELEEERLEENNGASDDGAVEVLSEPMGATFE